MQQRLAAVTAFVTAIAMFGLGMLLASISSGTGASPALLAVTGIVSEAGMAIVLLFAFSAVGAGPAPWVGRISALVAMLLLFLGDATQNDSLRVAGNAVFYATLILLGVLLWNRHTILGAFAALNGLIGFAVLATAEQLGIPDGINLLLVVVWLIALGIDWLRGPWGAGAPSHEARVSEPA